MKIAQVVCAFPPYKAGIGNVAFDFADILSRSGQAVTVFTPRYGGVQSGGHDNFKVDRLRPLLKYGNGAFIPGLFFKLSGFDIVHLHYPFFGAAEAVWLAKLAYGKKLRLFVHYHMDTDELSAVARILSLPSRLIRDFLFRSAESISCASLDYIENSGLSDFYRRYPHKFHETLFGVDTEKFYPVGDRRGSPGPAKILFVGALDRAHYFKGLDTLLGAVAGLPAGACRLQVIGEGDLRPGYEKRARELKIGDRVEFIGHADEENLIKYYQTADIFVLPSINRHEAFGLVLLEAMASGVPVIASSLPGVRKVFQEGIQGLLAEPGSVDDLRDKLNELLDDPQKRISMGRAGRVLAEERYKKELIEERLKKIYNIPQ